MAIVFRVKPWYKKEEKEPDTWETISFNNIALYGQYVWNTDNDVYYSYSGTDLKFSKNSKTWNYLWWDTSGQTLYGNQIWRDPIWGFYVHSYGGADYQYFLNESGPNWAKRYFRYDYVPGPTSGGTPELYGSKVFIINGVAYYGNGSSMYDCYLKRGGGYDYTSDQWTSKSWKYRYGSGTTTTLNISGDEVWTDGTNWYSTHGGATYMLDDVSTGIWDRVTFTGMPASFYTVHLWTDGKHTYYSNGSIQKVLDKNTKTWNNKTWNGLTDFYGRDIWTDGDNIYYSPGGYTHYILQKP